MRTPVLEALLNLATAFLLAPLLPGLVNRTKAWFGGRQGPPVLQLYYDLFRLWRKGAVFSSTTTWIFRAAPAVCLAALAGAVACVPLLPGTHAAASFEGDMLLFAYLLALARFATVLAALDTGSSFEGMGASREVTYAVLAEPVLLLSLAALWLASGSLSFAGTFAAVPRAGSAAAVGLVLVCLLAVLLIENCRIPFDDPNTHLELTMIHEVMVLDCSGPDFAMVLYGAALRLWVFAAIVARTALLIVPAAGWTGWILAPALLVLTAVVVGIVESSMARLRLVRVPHLLAGAAVLALTALLVLR